MNIKVVKIHQSNNILKKIRPYLGNMIGNLRASVEWKIQLTMKIDFMPSKDRGESQPMRSKTDIIEILIGNDTNKINMSFLVHFLVYFK